MRIGNVIKIGFCDSGIGGLILACDFIKYFLPTLKALSQAHDIFFEFYHICEGFPYGNKSDEEIIVTGSKMIHRLQRQIGCDILIVGCNTLSAKLELYNIYFESYRYNTFKVLPIVISSAEGIYNEALINAHNNNNENIEIMMFATPAAFRNNIYDKYIRYAHHKAKKNNLTEKNLIIKSFAPEIYWQQSVELGEIKNIENLKKIEIDMNIFLNNANFENLNAIGLFCTHYPAYNSIIENIVKQKNNSKNAVIASQGKLISQSVVNAFTNMFTEYKLPSKIDDFCDDTSFINIYSLYKNDSYSNIIKNIISELFGTNMSNLINII